MHSFPAFFCASQCALAPARFLAVSQSRSHFFASARGTSVEEIRLKAPSAATAIAAANLLIDNICWSFSVPTRSIYPRVRVESGTVTRPCRSAWSSRKGGALLFKMTSLKSQGSQVSGLSSLRALKAQGSQGFQVSGRLLFPRFRGRRQMRALEAPFASWEAISAQIGGRLSSQSLPGKRCPCYRGRAPSGFRWRPGFHWAAPFPISCFEQSRLQRFYSVQGGGINRLSEQPPRFLETD